MNQPPKKDKTSSTADKAHSDGVHHAHLANGVVGHGDGPTKKPGGSGAEDGSDEPAHDESAEQR